MLLPLLLPHASCRTLGQGVGDWHCSIHAVCGHSGKLQPCFLDEKERLVQSMKLEANFMPTCSWGLLPPGCYSCGCTHLRCTPRGQPGGEGNLPTLARPALSLLSLSYPALLVAAYTAVVWVGGSCVLCSSRKELATGEGSGLPGTPQCTPSQVLLGWPHGIASLGVFADWSSLHCCRINGHLLSRILPGEDGMTPSGRAERPLEKGHSGLGMRHAQQRLWTLRGPLGF